MVVLWCVLMKRRLFNSGRLPAGDLPLLDPGFHFFICRSRWLEWQPYASAARPLQYARTGASGCRAFHTKPTFHI
ncbi:unnamed protein product, partial [Iphiclides podalirius]